MTTLRPKPTAILAAALALAAAAPARASEADVFENKMEPVSGQLYGKAGRFEITPSFNVSLLDPFYTKYFGGLKLGYHFSEAWGAGLTFAAGTTSTTGSTTLCLQNQGCGPATPQQLYQVPGKIQMMVGGEAAWSPIYGKLNLIAEQVAHFDIALLAGVDWIRYQEAISGTAVLGGGTPAETSGVGGHLGLGVRIFLSRVLALRLEVKDYLYRAQIGNLDEQKLQNQLFAEMGLSVFFPGPRPTR